MRLYLLLLAHALLDMHPNGSLSTSQSSTSHATSSQSNASQETESQLAKKLLVIVNTYGKAVGPNQAEFKFNIPVTLARIHLEKGFGPKWRAIKSRMRTKYFKVAKSIEEAIGMCPKGFDPNHWAKFAIRERDPKVIARNKHNAENRKKNHSHFRVGGNHMPKSSTSWMKQNLQNNCELPDGTVPDSIKETYDKVKNAHERIMSSTSHEEGMYNYVGIDSDALTEVFGPEKKNRTRGVCSYTSKKQLQFAAIENALLYNADSSTSMLGAEMKEIKSDIKTMSQTFMALMQQGSSNPAFCAQPPQHL